jgi:hypothetical protein
MNQTFEVDLAAMIVPAIALLVCVCLERRNKVSTDGVPEPVEGTGARPKFKLIPSRKQQSTAKTPTDLLLQVRQSTDTKTPGQ